METVILFTEDNYDNSDTSSKNSKVYHTVIKICLKQVEYKDILLKSTTGKFNTGRSIHGFACVISTNFILYFTINCFFSTEKNHETFH